MGTRFLRFWGFAMARNRDWMTYTEACRVLGFGREALATLIRENGLTVRAIPGVPPKLRRDEVEALAARHTRTAAGELAQAAG